MSGSFFVLIPVFTSEMERNIKKAKAKDTIGIRIREMRRKAKLSQEQLAEAIYTKKATISAYENDRIDIKSSILLDIARVLGCTGSYLLEGRGETEIDMRVIAILSGMKSNQVKEIALKQLQTLSEIENSHYDYSGQKFNMIN